MSATHDLRDAASTRLAAAGVRVADLSDEERRLLERLQQTRAALARARAEHERMQREEERVRAGGRAPGPPIETWRRTVRQLGVFTVSELAAELEVSRPVAKKHLDAMLTHVPPLVVPAGRVLGKAAYEYVRPTEAGAAFEIDRRRAVVDEPIQYAEPVAGVSKNAGSAMIADKVVREAVRDAERRGWVLHKKGDGHFVLTKGTKRVPVAGSPSNPGGSADIVRRLTGGKGKT